MSTKNNPQISVIVTAFNDERYITSCLTALQNQTQKNLEIIVVDDASTDRTVAKIQQCQKRYKNIKLIQNPKNLGPSAARNEALKITKAPYIMFRDGDDAYDPTCCAKMLNAIETYHVDFACCEIKVIYENQNKLKASDDGYYDLKFAGRKVITRHDVQRLDLSVDNKIFRADLIKKHRLKFPKDLLYEDTYFVLAYLSFARHAFFLKEPLYFYQRHSGSIMANTFSTQKTEKDHSLDAIKIFIELYKFYQQQSRNQNPLTKDNEQIFFSQFSIFISSAKRWAKTKAKKREIDQTVEAFEQKNHVKVPRLKKRFLLRLAFKIIGRFAKIGNSQRWTLAKLKKLNRQETYKIIFAPANKLKD